MFNRRSPNWIARSWVDEKRYPAGFATFARHQQALRRFAPDDPRPPPEPLSVGEVEEFSRRRKGRSEVAVL